MWLQMVYSPKPHADSPFPQVLFPLHWWTDPCQVCIGVPILPSSLDKTIITNAFLVGWGEHMGNHMMQGTWTPGESRMHIIILELQAVRKVCQAFLPFTRSHNVLILLDNVATTVCYINKQGVTNSTVLCLEAINLWHWCIAHHILLSAAYLLGIQNVIADLLSRQFVIDHEWELHDSMVHDIFDQCGL